MEHVNKAQNLFQMPITLSLGDIITIVALFISLVLNIIQWRDACNLKASVYNGIVGVFNAIGWVLGYSIARENDLGRRINSTSSSDLKAALEEFSHFANSVDHQCRLLHEQVVAVAKTLRIKDARWQGQFFGLSKDEVNRILEASKGPG